MYEAARPRVKNSPDPNIVKPASNLVGSEIRLVEICGGLFNLEGHLQALRVVMRI